MFGRENKIVLFVSHVFEYFATGNKTSPFHSCSVEYCFIILGAGDVTKALYVSFTNVLYSKDERSGLLSSTGN